MVRYSAVTASFGLEYVVLRGNSNKLASECAVDCVRLEYDKVRYTDEYSRVPSVEDSGPSHAAGSRVNKPCSLQPAPSERESARKESLLRNNSHVSSNHPFPGNASGRGVLRALQMAGTARLGV